MTPPGTLRHLNRTSCSSSSSPAMNSIHSPVAGLKKGRKRVTAASARRTLLVFGDEILRDRDLLTLLGDDEPRSEVGQSTSAPGQQCDDRYQQAKQGDVGTEVLGQPTA